MPARTGRDGMVIFSGAAPRSAWAIGRYEAGFSLLLAPMLLVSSIACAAQGAATELAPANEARAPETYTWNRVLPPQMSRHADVVSLGRDALCRDVRPDTKWTKDEELRTSEQVLAWRRDITEFTTRHDECWKQVVVQERYSLPTLRKVHTSDGFDETRRNMLTQTLSAELTAGSQATAMTVQIKADLQKTEEVVRLWKTSEEKDIEVTFPPNTRVSVWALVETVRLIRRTTSIFTLGSQRRVTNQTGPNETTTAFEYTKSIYHDLATDAEMQRVNPKAFGKN